ncbi:MAG: outer membrane lipoprotein carrier protein LolA, partial [Pseudomonadota bacterium]
MKRRVFLGAASAALIARPALAERIPLDRISAYLNTLTIAESPFTQIGDDGSILTGRIVIRRPGRLRFEYDPPNETLVIASAGTIGIFDPASNIRNAERYPLRRTPLKLILEKDVDLGRREMVVGHEFDGTSTDRR